MRHILKKFPTGKRKVVLTIGMFDGLHRGHKFILRTLIRRAEKLGVRSAVVTFWPHPQRVLGVRFEGHITDPHQKMRMISSVGVDYIWVLKSTQGLLKMRGKDFIEKLASHLDIVEIVVGDDFKFGYKRKEDVQSLKGIASSLGFRVVTVKKRKIRGKVISSSFIRRLIKKGRFKEARLCLGRAFILELPVIKGRGRGRKLGYPTVNLDYDNFVVPESGVYAVCVRYRGRIYLGAANIGYRPTFGGKNLSFEIHLIGFRGNIVRKKISILFLEKLRKERKFSSISSLIRQIQKDISYIVSRYSTSHHSCAQLIVP